MSVKSVQFTVAAHIMAALGFYHGKELSSAILAASVNADPTFVRKSLSKLSKAGLVVTTRGKGGASGPRPEEVTVPLRLTQRGMRIGTRHRCGGIL